jgi:hypothetical protein
MMGGSCVASSPFAAGERADVRFFLFGDPQDVAGQSLNRGSLYDADDTVSASLVLGDGISVSASWSFVIPEKSQKDRIHITSDTGSLEFSVFSFETIRLHSLQGIEEYDTIQPEHIQMPFIQSILHDIRGTGRCPSDGQSGAITSRVMDQLCSCS